MPTVHGPPLRTISARPSCTCSAMVGESSVNRFALGAAIGICAASINARASGCAGIRRPTLGSPAVTTSGTREFFGTMIVRGPGQKRFARRSAFSGPFARQPARHFDRRHVDDQRTRIRPSLGFEDALHGRFVERIRAQPVDGLGRERDQASGAQQLRRSCYFGAHSGMSAPSPAVLPVLCQTRYA